MRRTVLLIVDGRYWCGFCDAVFFDNVLLIVDGRHWCGFCDAAFFDNAIPTIYDERMLSKNAASQKPYQNLPSMMR
jgi:thiol-disulfide isomerase/thioredoxin